MTKTAEARELAERLMEFLDDVNHGHEVLVTRGQKPIARLVPVNTSSRREGRSVLRLRALPGKWTGETVLKSGDLAEEMFARERLALTPTCWLRWPPRNIRATPRPSPCSSANLVP